MIEKELHTRMIQKHDIEVNWDEAINFIPKKGELIVYDPDENYNYSRVKIGDGISTADELPFIIAVDTSLTQSGQAADAKAVGDALEGKQPIGDYVLANKLPEVIDDALTQAKASGEFDGPQGPKGDAGKTTYLYADIEDGCLVIHGGQADDITFEINEKGELVTVYE